jgi:hypothetical protein
MFDSLSEASDERQKKSLSEASENFVAHATFGQRGMFHHVSILARNGFVQIPGRMGGENPFQCG